MFSIFRKKANVVSDLNWLGVDIHSHMLPGLDDGAKDVNESLLYIKAMEEMGLDKLFFTPHIFTELYPNSKETILPALHDVQTIYEGDLKELGAAAEYMVDHDFRVDDDLMCLPHNHLLIEMSYLSETPNIEQTVFDLQVKGYKLILAHPERYNFYHNNTKRYQRLKEMGCSFQLNLLSIVGYYGKHVSQAAEFLLKENLYDFAASDLHHNKHLSLLKREVKSGNLYKMIGTYQFKNKSIFG